MTETIAEILAAHRSGASPEETVARTYARIRQHNDPAIFITLRDEKEALVEAKTIAAQLDPALPLFGVPFAVKDNIDVGGMPTTAACPDFAYVAKNDATSVARLRAAGAIVIGKTNLDQFATGLVGVRSPYGVPRNVFDPKLIPGGSSSGSGVAVAAGLVPFSLGTDTAGSGRVPAGLGNIVGLKPSLGVISTAGVVPACRTLDCVSVFACTVDEAWAVFSAMAGPDIADPFTRNRAPGTLGALPANLRIGVPIKGERVFFGDQVSAAQFEAAVERFAALGAAIVEIDIEPFYETARLLYEGPWVAERYHVVRRMIASSPESMHPVTREIIAAGRALERGRCVCGVLQAGGSAPRARSHLPQHRRAAPADHADRLHGRPGSGRPDPAQLTARHLHEFRQPARSGRPRGAGEHAAGSARRSASRCSRPADAMRCSARSAGYSTPIRACRSARPARRSRRWRRSQPRRRRARSRSRSSARICRACR